MKIQKAHQEAIHKIRKAIQVAINKTRVALYAHGVQVRKAESTRKKRVQELIT